MVGCKGCKSDSEYELTDSAMAAIDSICEDLAKVEPIYCPPDPPDPEYNPKGEGTIKEVCDEVNTWEMSPEVAAHFDSMNAVNYGGGYFIRGAERNLDTIVNHVKIVFMTKE